MKLRAHINALFASLARMVSDEEPNVVSKYCMDFILSQLLPIFLLISASLLAAMLILVFGQEPAESVFYIAAAAIADAGTCMSISAALIEQKKGIEEARRRGEWPKVIDKCEYDAIMDVLAFAKWCSWFHGFILVWAIMAGFGSEWWVMFLYGTVAACLSLLSSGVVSGTISAKLVWLSKSGAKTR